MLYYIAQIFGILGLIVMILSLFVIPSWLWFSFRKLNGGIIHLTIVGMREWLPIIQDWATHSERFV